ncbi:hypothetical protein [Streptomyces sp. NPDC005336]|uniref:hypothetical protein n=1 Tax=unclassified Streptomyces TaxID=2593676 RepID=UPI0033B8C31E
MSADRNHPEPYEKDVEDVFEDPLVNIDESAEFSIEAPEADAAEQHYELVPHRDEPVSGDELMEANEADRAEQARVVEVNENEEDYR